MPESKSGPQFTVEQLEEITEALKTQPVTEVLDRYGVEIEQLRTILSKTIEETTTSPQRYRSLGTIKPIFSVKPMRPKDVVVKKSDKTALIKAITAIARSRRKKTQ